METVENQKNANPSSTPNVPKAVDIKAYSGRIGYKGEWAPSLDCLKAIHFLHPQSIPFENLNPLLGIPVLLDINSIQEKLLQNGRGGYCFEHNLLLMNVLKALGFKVKGLAARVLWNLPEDAVTARGHMLLLVEIEDMLYISDVGFGGLTLTAPLLLKAGVEQETPHELFRLKMDRNNYLLQAKVKDEWKSLYKFSLEEQLLPDYEVTNWYLSNHPNSHFVTGLIAARSTPDKRYALRNTNFSIHHLDGTTEKKMMKSVPQLSELLLEVFKIRLPENHGLEQSLEQLVLLENQK